MIQQQHDFYSDKQQSYLKPQLPQTNLNSCEEIISPQILNKSITLFVLSVFLSYHSKYFFDILLFKVLFPNRKKSI